jgi:ATP-dependent DNA helicase PIF1
MTQQEALDLLMMGENVYLTGQAGSGKTFLLNRYVRFLRENNISAAVTATTGIAATHLGGITIHSWSGIGIKSVLTGVDIARINSRPQADKIRSAKVLVIDEISMFHSYRLDMVDQVCRAIRQDTRPFGGLQVILCGDFFQLPPIDEQGFPPASFAFKSQAWADLDLRICYLDEQHRQWDESFLRVLNAIRTTDVSEYTVETLSARMNKTLALGIRPTRLYTHNIDVDAINNMEIAKIDRPARVYPMHAEGAKPLVDTLKKGCLAPVNLVIKEGAEVMFVKNNPAKGYINGTLGRVIGFDEDYPLIRTNSGEEITATPASWTLEDNDEILAQVSQIPLRLAWAITVHKSQGMSLDAAEIDLSKSFAYGMGYVALSRVRSLEGIRLLGLNPMSLLVDREISEIDRQFQQVSRIVSAQLHKLTKKEIHSRQKKYLTQLLPSKKSPSLSRLVSRYFPSTKP